MVFSLARTTPVLPVSAISRPKPEPNGPKITLLDEATKAAHMAPSLNGSARLNGLIKAMQIMPGKWAFRRVLDLRAHAHAHVIHWGGALFETVPAAGWLSWRKVFKGACCSNLLLSYTINTSGTSGMSDARAPKSATPVMSASCCRWLGSGQHLEKIPLACARRSQL